MNLSQLDDLTDLLVDVPRLVGLFESKSNDFVPSVKRWLGHAELVMQGARMGVVSRVAAERATVLAAEAGVPPQGLALPPRSGRHKMKAAAALHALGVAQDVVVGATEDARQTFDQSERVLRGLLATASRRGLLNNGLSPPFELRAMKHLWSQMVADPEIGPHASQVVSVIGLRDALALARRVLSAWARDQQEESGDVS